MLFQLRLLDPGKVARHHALDEIRGLEARAELGKHVEAMERQGFPETFLQTARGRLIDQRQCRELEVCRQKRLMLCRISSARFVQRNGSTSE